MSEVQKNVLGEDLEICGSNPITGYLRDGCCNTDNFDRGSHTVCAVVTDEILCRSYQYYSIHLLDIL